MVAAQEEPSAYAKLLGRLDGQQFHCYVMALPSTLGRSSGTSATEGDRKPSGFIDLGKSKAISREHGEYLRCRAVNRSTDIDKI